MNLTTLWKLWKAGVFVYNVAKPHVRRWGKKRDIDALPEYDPRWQEGEESLDFVILYDTKKEGLIRTLFANYGQFGYAIAETLPVTHPLYTPTSRDRWGVTWLFTEDREKIQLFVSLTRPGLILTDLDRKEGQDLALNEAIALRAVECRKALAFPNFNGVVRFGFTQYEVGNKTLFQRLKEKSNLVDWMAFLNQNSFQYMLMQDDTTDYPYFFSLEDVELALGHGSQKSPLVLRLTPIGKVVTLFPNRRVGNGINRPSLGREYRDIFQWMEPTVKTNGPVVHDVMDFFDRLLAR